MFDNFTQFASVTSAGVLSATSMVGISAVGSNPMRSTVSSIVETALLDPIKKDRFNFVYFQTFQPSNNNFYIGQNRATPLGSFNHCVGVNAGHVNTGTTIGSKNHFTGMGAGLVIESPATRNTGVGGYAMAQLASPGQPVYDNTGIGSTFGGLTFAYRSTAIGARSQTFAGPGNVRSFLNTSVGSLAMGKFYSFYPIRYNAYIGRNVAMGYGAGRNMGSKVFTDKGSFNTAFGSKALSASPGAYNNVALGFQAGQTLRTTISSALDMVEYKGGVGGNNNVLVGVGAGQSLYALQQKNNYVFPTYALPTDGHALAKNNVMMGVLAGVVQQNVDKNVFSGYRVSYQTTAASNCIFKGYKCAGNVLSYYGVNRGGSGVYYATAGSDNIIIGHNALRAAFGTSTGFRNNVMIGLSAGTGVSIVTTAPFWNIFSGYKVARRITSASRSIAKGSKAGYRMTTHVGGVFIGYSAGGNFTDDSYGVAIGSKAAGGAASGNTAKPGVAIGSNTSLNSLSGRRNVSIGYNAGRSEAGSAYSVLIGYNVSPLTTSHTTNVIMGANANNTATGSISSMTAIGFGVAPSGNGRANSVFGYNAGLNLTSGTKNSFFGYKAGSTTTIGSLNTSVGYKAGPSTSSGAISGSIRLGYGAIATATNQLCIGSASNYANGKIATLSANVTLSNWGGFFTMLINGSAARVPFVF